MDRDSRRVPFSMLVGSFRVASSSKVEVLVLAKSSRFSVTLRLLFPSDVWLLRRFVLTKLRNTRGDSHILLSLSLCRLSPSNCNHTWMCNAS